MDIIATPRSKLTICDIKFTNDFIMECVREIRDKLETNPEIVVRGRVCNQRRSVGFFSDSSEGYRYSGRIMKSKPMTPKIKELISTINEKLGSEFNGILINEYKNGNDTIGKHSDDEIYLDKSGVVSLSVGATRTFRIRSKVTNKIIEDIPLTHGDVVHMAGDFQKEFTHEIPAEKTVTEPRISFTFRKHIK